jgi:two-component system chemotaxis response regulator CheY
LIVVEPKILVVDDSATLRRCIVNVLREIGYSNISEASDGGEALQIMKEQPFQLVITDWNMPKIDGVALTTIMRQTENYRDIPVLMVTSRSVAEDILEAVDAGIDGYVVKPFTIEVMRRKIKQIFSGI